MAAYLERPDRFAYVLCRTSNAGGADIQGLARSRRVGGGRRLAAPDEPLWARVARNVRWLGPGWDCGSRRRGDRAGGAARGARDRPGARVPGARRGSQGGATEPVLAFGPATEPPAGGRPGGGLVVNVSRGISQAASGGPGRAAGASVDGAPNGAANGAPRGLPTDPGERIAEAARSWSARLPVLP